MDRITVTTNKEALWAIRIANMSIFVLDVSGALLACNTYITLLLISFYMPLLLITLYYETWKMVFYKDKIEIRKYFATKTYTYGQLSDIACANSTTLGWHIRMRFSNGKKACFRMQDVNAQKAVNRIAKHKSIRSIR